jgi:small redox-active disulfide protein 2
VETAVQELEIEASVEKISDISEIVAFGVMMTPALVVDGKVKAMGNVPSTEQIKQMLK